MNRLYNYKNAFRILKGGKISLVVSAFLTTASIVNAAPTGGNVTSGNATISQNGNVTNINQSSNKASINWQEFSIGKNETVNFNQPNSNSITLNKVVGTSNSLIQGAMNANGQVILVNPNGVVFTEGSNVNVGGLIATTKNITEQDFQNGNYKFEGDSSASIINKGTINAKYVAMMGKEVVNEGKIVATMGRVELSSGDKFTLNLNGDSLLKLTIDEGTLNALVENKGLIKADGGVVYLTTQAVDSILDGMVNNTGIIEAQTLNTNDKGEIVLFAHGGTANVAGEIKAEGGFVETSGDKVKIADDFKVKAKDWLIDPNDFTIAASGGDISGTTLSSNLASANVEIQTATMGTAGGNGDIHVNDNVTWSSGNTLTLTAERNININSTVDASSGSGGKVVLNYGQGAVAANNTATYNFGLTSSGFAGKINLQAGQNFSTKLGSDGTQVDYTVITSLGTQADATSAPSTMTLQGIRTNLTGKYVLGANINASATSAWGNVTIGDVIYNGFVPLSDGYTIGGVGNFTTTNQFKGDFIGLGNSISGLYIDLTNVSNTDHKSNNAALFGATGNASTYIGHFSLEDSTIKGGMVGGVAGYAYSYTTFDNIYIKNDVNLISTSATGGIAGVTTGVFGATTVKNSYGYSTITSTGGERVGGLVGDSWASTIKDSFTGGSVSGYSAVGGAVGWINGGTNLSHLISSSTVTGTGDGIGGVVGAASAANLVTYSSATGNVSGRYSVGGFIGSMSNTTVDYSYSTGSVSGQAAVGGFVGSVIGSGTSQISHSYSTGSVTGAITQIGGFVGSNSGRIDQSYATGSVSASGASDVGGFVGYIFTNNFEGPGAIYNSYTLSSVLGGSNVGGFAGRNNAGTLNATTGTIINSYSAGTVTGTSNVGAFIGENPTNGYITNSFWNTDNTSSLTGIGSGDTTNTTTLLGKTASQMKISDTFLSWGSEIVEDNNLSNTYPVLRWTNDGLTSGSSIWVISPSSIGLNYNLSDQTFVYDGNNHLLSSLWSASSIFGSDYSSWVLGTDYDFIYDGNISSNTNFKNVGNYGLSIAINKDGYRVGTNYTNGMLSITPKALTISGLSSANKIYDGTTTAIVNGTALFGTETVGSGTTSDGKAYTGDAVSLNGTAVGTFNDKNVADATTVTFSGLSLTGADAGNYTLTPHSTVSNSITAKVLTISGTTAQDKIYDGTVNATANLGTLSGFIGNETVNASAIGTFASKDVGNRTATFVYTLADGTNGGLADNYVLANTTDDAVISKKTLTISGDDWIFANDKTYDGNANTTVDILFGNGRALVNGLIGSETLDITADGVFNNPNAGFNKDVDVSFNLADGSNDGLASNYEIANITKQSNILKKYISVTGDFSANDKVYDGNKTATFATNNIALDGVVNGENLTLSGLGLEFIDKNVGNSKTVKLIGGAISSTQTGNANNYVFTLGEVPPTTTANITPKALTITSTVDDKVYDGNTNANVNLGVLNGLIGNETLDNSAIGTFDNANAGNRTATIVYTLSNGLNGGLASNYILANTTANATIARKTLTINGTTANDKIYDGTTTAVVNIGTLNGLIGSETLNTSVVGTFDNANTGNRTVTFVYTLANGTDGGLSDNYLLSNTINNAQINKANVNYLIDNSTLVSGEKYILPTPSLIGGTPSGTTTVKIYDLENKDVTQEALAGTLKAGKYSVKTIDLEDENYQLANDGNVDGILTINQNVKIEDIITNIVNNAVKPNLPVLSLNPIRTDVVNGFERRVNSTIVNNKPQIGNENTLGSLNLGLNEIIRSVKPAVNEIVKENKLTIVGETGGESKIEIVELQDLVAQSGGGELRVALSPNSFVELVNGGVNLPDGVSQEFYVVEDKK